MTVWRLPYDCLTTVWDLHNGIQFDKLFVSRNTAKTWKQKFNGEMELTEDIGIGPRGARGQKLNYMTLCTTNNVTPVMFKPSLTGSNLRGLAWGQSNLLMRVIIASVCPSHSVRQRPYSSFSTTLTASGIAWVSKNLQKYFKNKAWAWIYKEEMPYV